MNQPNKKKLFGHIEVPLKRIHIELTNICNFDCVFCPKDEMKRPPGFMDVDLAKGIINTVKANGICDKITFHVMGEPTLHPKFFEVLDYARTKDVNVGLTTNGTGLTGKAGKRLVDYDLHQIDVSLQTPDEKSFQLRKAGKISFDDYVEGLFDFLSAYNIREKKTTFKFRFLNTKFSGSDMHKKMDSQKINSTNRDLQKTFRHWAERVYDVLGVNGTERERALEKIKKLASYRWNVVQVHDNVFFETYILTSWNDASANSDVRDAWSGHCYGMRDHFAILYNGDVVLCCMDFNGKTSIGNLKDQSLEEILSTPELKEIIDGFKKYRIVHPYCKKCLGSKTFAGWIFKPFGYTLSQTVLKPFFYRQSSIWKQDSRES